MRLDSYGFLKTWAGYTLLNTDKSKIAEATERWNESMELMGLNYTFQQFLMLDSEKFN